MISFSIPSWDSFLKLRQPPSLFQFLPSLSHPSILEGLYKTIHEQQSIDWRRRSLVRKAPASTTTPKMMTSRLMMDAKALLAIRGRRFSSTGVMLLAHHYHHHAPSWVIICGKRPSWYYRN